MKQIKKFGIVQTAKVAAILYLVFGAIFLVPMTLITLVASGEAASLFLILLLPVYAIGGFIVVAICCWIYNLVAGKFGGIEIEIE